MDGYQEFLLTVRRDINCLSDADRNTRRGAIIRLDKVLAPGGKVAPEFVQRLLLEELHKPLFRMFGDQTEKCRDVSFAMTLRLIEPLPAAELDNLLPLLLSALLGRFRTLPFPEPSEELRVVALQLLSRLFDLCGPRLDPFAGEIVDALAKALTDTCPDAKKECCEITKKVAAHLGAERVSRAGGGLVASLLANLRHQQWKVRRATLDSLGALLSLEAPMLDHMEDVLPSLGELLHDRTTGVRQCLAECLERWLVRGLAFRAPAVAIYDDDGPGGFEKLEPRLLLLLLGGIADEDAGQVALAALGGLERAAEAKREARRRSAEAQRRRQEARAAAGAEEMAVDGGAEAAARELEPAPAFDYSAVAGLLPDPFASGRQPAALTTAYVSLHMSALLPQILTNITQWQTDSRAAAAQQLRAFLVLANRQIAPFLDQVLVHLYKAAADDEPRVAQVVLQCAGLAGVFVEAELLLGLVGRHLGLRLEGGAEKRPGGGQGMEELWPETVTGRAVTRTVQDVAAGVRHFAAMGTESRRQVFTVLARLLSPEGAAAPASAALGPREVKAALHFLEEGAKSEELLPAVLGAVQALLRAGGTACCGEWPRLFDLLLRMRSGEECAAATVDGAMDRLAELCGKTRRGLYEEHLHSRLGELLRGAEAQLWEERSPNRHVLETLLRNAGAAAAPHLAGMVPVFARQASPEDASAPARVDLLGLVHFLVTVEDADLSKALRAQAPALLRTVLVPNCSWRPGQSNNKIRKAGMVCIHALLQRHYLAAAELNEAFSELLPILKSCLDDSWSPDNRLLACLVLSCTLGDMQAEITGEQLREVYPELLKRLDDSNDSIRAAVCGALETFFKCLPPQWSRSLLEYILRTLFVHLDDPNPEIQQGVYAVLQAAVHQDHETFLLEAQAAGAKSSHPRLCEELARLAESLRQAM
mmetsp:Transcript_103269/g.301251  ORF Transcript_103269/g.301251 Transcript_103269/m.301251 type:complete len:932 (+) Transcript_103269:71-2866(+)